MTILQALNNYYDRLAARGGVAKLGYAVEKLSYAIVLSADGEVVDVQCLLVASDRKPRPRPMEVPTAVKRTSGVAANLLWDKTSYVLGVSVRTRQERAALEREVLERETARLAAEHVAFRKLHQKALANTYDEGLVALRWFLERWSPERFDEPPFFDEMRNTNLVFRLDGERCFLHERKAAQELVTAHVAETAGEFGLCLVTGTVAPIARLHPAIKGVQGAQSSGASIVSFNLNAFESFGKSQGSNAPVSERAAFGYGTALNSLLAGESRNRIRIGNVTTVFWAEATEVGDSAATAAEDLFGLLVSPPTDGQEAARVADVLRDVSEGRPLSEVDPKVRPETLFHVLGLSPNASRLSVRYWHVDTIGTFTERIADHWRDIRIEPRPWKMPPAAWRLLYETAAQRKVENIPPLLGGALMRAILIGGRYPQALLATVMMRMRVDRVVNGMRAAICKACLSRDFRLGFEEEDVPVSLDPNEPNAAYRLGRLFAVLEGTQRAALGNINATIRDRYFGAASSTPALTFPTLFRSARNHLKTIRGKRGEGLANWFDKEIGAIVDGFDSTVFPRSLGMTEQGRFAIGYYHQREALYRRKAADGPTELTDADLDESEELAEEDI